MSESRTVPVLIGHGPELFLTRPGLSGDALAGLHADWARTSQRRGRVGASVGFVAGMSVVLVVWFSLLTFTGAAGLAVVAAGVAGLATGALSRTEAMRGLSWKHGTDVAPLSAADRVLGSQLTGAVDTARQHALLWYLASARFELSSAQERCSSPAVRNDAEALELLTVARDAAQERLTRVRDRVRELALTA